MKITRYTVHIARGGEFVIVYQINIDRLILYCVVWVGRRLIWYLHGNRYWFVTSSWRNCFNLVSLLFLTEWDGGCVWWGASWQYPRPRPSLPGDPALRAEESGKVSGLCVGSVEGVWVVCEGVWVVCEETLDLAQLDWLCWIRTCFHAAPVGLVINAWQLYPELKCLPRP